MSSITGSGVATLRERRLEILDVRQRVTPGDGDRMKRRSPRAATELVRQRVRRVHRRRFRLGGEPHEELPAPGPHALRLQSRRDPRQRRGRTRHVCHQLASAPFERELDDPVAQLGEGDSRRRRRLRNETRLRHTRKRVGFETDKMFRSPTCENQCARTRSA